MPNPREAPNETTVKLMDSPHVAMPKHFHFQLSPDKVLQIHIVLQMVSWRTLQKIEKNNNIDLRQVCP